MPQEASSDSDILWSKWTCVKQEKDL